MKGLTSGICSSCSSAPGSENKLLICGRCKGEQYCNVTCQKNHFNIHKTGCKTIGKLLTSLEENHLSNEKVKRFLTDDTTDCQWNDLITSIPDLPNKLVQLVRAMQPVLAAYVDMGIHNKSATPVERALSWLMKGLKVVTFHTDHMKEEEKEMGQGKTNRLYFGGDWSYRRDVYSINEGVGITNHDQMSCEHFDQREKDRRFRPNGDADPFFCFGGEQNIPEMLVLLGRHQEAVDFMAHWVTPDIWGKDHVKGAIVNHWKNWIVKNYASVDMMKIPPPPGHPDFSNFDYFEGESDSKILMRVLAVETLIRVHVINSDQFKASENMEMKKKHYRFLYSSIYANIHCTDNGVYFITGDERYKSRFSLFRHGADPREEVDRLVWRLFRDHSVGLTDQELNTVLNMFQKINEEFRKEDCEGFTDEELMA